MEMKKIKQIMGEYARDRLNTSVGLQNEITAATEFRSAVEESCAIIEKAEAAAESLRTLEGQIVAKQKELAGWEKRSAEVLGGFKAKQIEQDNRDKAQNDRERVLDEREARITVREQRMDSVLGHVQTLREVDA